MLKVLLCVLLFVLCVGCAFWLTRKYRKRKDFFYNLDLFNERLLNEVSYTRIPLPAFAEKYEFTGDFRKMLEDKKDDFQAEKYEFEYFRMVGGGDAASQKTYLSALRKEIEDQRRASDEVYKRYFSLYLKLGVLAGLVLIILLV